MWKETLERDQSELTQKKMYTRKKKSSGEQRNQIPLFSKAGFRVKRQEIGKGEKIEGRKLP